MQVKNQPANQDNASNFCSTVIDIVFDYIDKQDNGYNHKPAK